MKKKLKDGASLTQSQGNVSADHDLPFLQSLSSIIMKEGIVEGTSREK